MSPFRFLPTIIESPGTGIYSSKNESGSVCSRSLVWITTPRPSYPPVVAFSTYLVYFFLIY